MNNSDQNSLLSRIEHDVNSIIGALDTVILLHKSGSADKCLPVLEAALTRLKKVATELHEQQK